MSNPIPTRTSFKTGHQFSPEINEKRRQTMIQQYRFGLRKLPKPNWTPEKIEEMVKNNRKTRLISKPIGSRRKHWANAKFPYWQIKISDRGRWKYEHRYVMEKKLGHPLNNNEIVHHKNHNTLDNREENLVLMTASKHSYFHGKLKPFNPKFTNKLPKGKWSVKFDFCIECHTTKIKHRSHGRCDNCSERFRRNN